MLVNDYTKDLLLLYIKNAGHNYNFSDAKELLGLTQNQLTNLLRRLCRDDLLMYEGYSLKLTKKAVRRLISQNKWEYNLQQDTLEPNNINKKTQLRIDDPYVPLNFDKKYSLR